MWNIMWTLSSLVMLTAALPAAETLREFRWSGLKTADALPVGDVIADEATSLECLKIINDSDGPLTAAVLSIDNPGVTKSVYALVGQVRYDNVEGTGCLEMWSYFPDGGRFYSRTLQPRGLMQSIEGSSPWRPFSLPFFISGRQTGKPIRLVVNVVLPARGTLFLGPLALKQYDVGEDPLRMPGAWWSDRTGGLVGGVGGGALGVIGALVGVLAGIGKSRRFVLSLMGACGLLGAGALAAGIVALAACQPWEVWYPLVLGGGIATVVFGGLLPVARLGYARRELHKISAADAA